MPARGMHYREDRAVIPLCFFSPIGFPQRATAPTAAARTSLGPTAFLAVSHAIPPSTTRIAVGITISAAAHLLVAVSLSPRVAGEAAWPSPLQVEIVRAAPPETRTEIAVPGLSDHAGTAAPVQLPAETRSQEEPSHAPAARKAAVQFDLPFDRYFTARELDVRAARINEVQLVYPKQAYAMRISGKVILRIFINEKGGIDMISMLAATPPGVFEETALTTAQALQFSPALKNGRQVKSQKTIEVAFDPYESINIP